MEIIPCGCGNIKPNGWNPGRLHHMRLAHQRLSPAPESDDGYLRDGAWSARRIHDGGGSGPRRGVRDNGGWTRV